MSKTKTNYDVDVAALPRDELESMYQKLIASRTEIKAHNKRLSKWAAANSKAITALSSDASLAFQLLAEKAGVRSHPSVTATVKMFDALVGPQWHDEEHSIPRPQFPTDWELDPPGSWSGDADMQLNAPISELIEFLEHHSFGMKAEQVSELRRLTSRVQDSLSGCVQGIKEASGFCPAETTIPDKHFRDMSESDLREAVESLSWMALDLAQDMHFANHMLRRDLRASVYRRVCGDLYRMSQVAMEPRGDVRFDVKVFGGEVAA